MNKFLAPLLEGYRELGQRYGETMLSLLGNKAVRTAESKSKTEP